jgi:hypothetical protein
MFRPSRATLKYRDDELAPRGDRGGGTTQERRREAHGTPSRRI